MIPIQIHRANPVVRSISSTEAGTGAPGSSTSPWVPGPQRPLSGKGKSSFLAHRVLASQLSPVGPGTLLPGFSPGRTHPPAQSPQSSIGAAAGPRSMCPGEHAHAHASHRGRGFALGWIRGLFLTSLNLSFHCGLDGDSSIYFIG